MSRLCEWVRAIDLGRKGNNKLTRSEGLWYCCTGYVSIVSPLINYGLGHINGGSLHPWQYMYLVAGAITM